MNRKLLTIFFAVILTLTFATLACGGEEAAEEAVPTPKKKSTVQILGKSTPYAGKEKSAAEHIEVKKDEPKEEAKAEPKAEVSDSTGAAEVAELASRDVSRERTFITFQGGSEGRHTDHELW
ncbi:MAG: hypothetical protein CL764_00490, partial [Chloroflexi bacterium]|nr:hypothetical protein [Chloroflexota bacterium]